MRNHPLASVRVWSGAAAVLALVYIALIAIVMSYAALTVQFSEQVRNDEAAVADLEAQYLASVKAVTATDYAALGYAKPVAQAFVRAESGTALR